MNNFAGNWNGTVSTSHMSIIMPLISLMSTHFLVNSFTLITDSDTTTTFPFVRSASTFYLKIACKESFKKKFIRKAENYGNYEGMGYIVMGKPDFSFISILRKKPKLVTAIYTTNGSDPRPQELFSKLTIPTTTSFFVILLPDNFSPSNHEATIRCLRLYKPTPTYPLKAVPTMFYGGQDNPQWTWEQKKMNWNSFQLEVRKMNGIIIKIALISPLEEKVALDKFWNGSQSFYWKAMEEYYEFRCEIVFAKISLIGNHSLQLKYAKMLTEKTDTIAVLPIMTSERTDFMSFIITGIDQKHHLLVRTSQYWLSWQSIFKPLAVESWVGLAVAILLISITLRIALCWEKSSLADLFSCCLTIFGFVCAQGCPHMPRNLSSCIICFTALLMSIVIYQFYTSNFYSLLKTKEVKLPFTSLEDFLAKRTHALYLMPESALYVDIRFSRNGTLKKVWDLVKKDPSHQLTADNQKEVFEKVCKGDAAIFALPYQLITSENLTCELVPVNSGYFPAPTVTPLRQRYPFKSQLEFLHLRFIEAGITHRFRDEHYKLQNKIKPKKHQDMNIEAVSFVHVAFLLALFVVCIILSWVILFIEILVSKFTKTKKIKRGVWIA